MLTEYLTSHPLRLRDGAAPLPFPPAADRRSWGGIAPEHRREILDNAEKYRSSPYPMRLATGFMAFVRTGSRVSDEGPYFFRRRKLCWAALACCADESAAMDDVIDGLWCVLEETSWVISAHNVNPVPGAPDPKDRPLPDPETPYVDLFAAQTGMILSLIRRLLKDRLDAVSPVISARISREVRRRVLTPFMETDDFWWMGVRRTDLNNWTPWIISNVLYCAVCELTDGEALSALIRRALLMLDRWLACVPADGGCDEGAGYWNMAGGALLDCLEILDTVTDGQLTFWREEKIRNIMRFPLKAALGGGWFLNFADCDARPLLSGERLQYAGERLNDPTLAAFGAQHRGTLAAQLDDVPHFGRLLQLLFHPAPAAPQPVLLGDVWLPDLQVRVVRRGGFVLCCKGGHNGESHNHNDVGSFMLFMDGEPKAVDAGNMTYTAKTFSDERYTLWNVRSAYHNLPLPGGLEQLPGAEYAARAVRFLENGLSLDLAAAYPPAAGLRTLNRGYALTERGLTLRDRAEFSRPQPVSWVFMLRTRPSSPGPGRLVFGGMRLSFPEGLRYALEEIPVSDPRMARSFPGSLWRVVLTGAPAPSHNATFVFERDP